MSLTLAAYADAKKLEISFLRSLGLSEFSNHDGKCVRIPYRDANGMEGTARYRHALDGPHRFTWKSGAKTMLYGQDRLSEARERRMIVIVEGESDCHTLWQEGIAAIGLPGNGGWNEARDAHLFDGIENIFVIREPEKSGDGVMNWLSKSAIRHRAQVVTMGESEGEAKDPSALYLEDPANFWERMCQTLAKAVPFHTIEAEIKSQEAKAALELCRDLAQSSDILAAFRQRLAAIKVVGEDRNAAILYLAFTSRLLSRPVSLAVKGPSSGGKSFVCDRVRDHFPKSAYIDLTSMSERYLVFLEEDLRHRILLFAEATGAEGEMQSYLLRSLLSEGRLTYGFIDKTEGGLSPRRLEKEGPTGLIITTTKIRVHEENETRLLSLNANDTYEQTGAIMESIAMRRDDELAAIPPQWHALQTWLEHGERRVVVPYLLQVSRLALRSAVRMRRDFSALKSLIEAHALLHRASRERDGEGAIVATLADYSAVRALVADLLAEGHAATVKPQVREVVEAVKALTGDGSATTGRAIAARLGLDSAVVSRRCAEAMRLGFIVNGETTSGRKARYVIGDAMPEDVPVLPTVADLVRTLGEEEGGGGAMPDLGVNRATLLPGGKRCAVDRAEPERDPPPPTAPASDVKEGGGGAMPDLGVNGATLLPGGKRCAVDCAEPERDPPPPAAPDGEDAADLLDRFDERAAILEYDAGLPRAEAERRAREEVYGTKAPAKEVEDLDEEILQLYASAAA